MNREQKTVAVCVLTSLFLALGNWLTKGVFMFTFPINDYLLLGVGLYFAFLHHKTNLLEASLMGLFPVFLFFGNIYNYEMLMSTQQMASFSETSWLEVFHWTADLCFSLLVLRFFNSSAWKFAIIYVVLLTALLFAGEFTGNFIILNVCYLLFALVIRLDTNFKARNFQALYYFLVLLCVLNATTIYSLYF